MVTAWSVRAWPPVTCPALRTDLLHWQHVGTHFAPGLGPRDRSPGGQTLWTVASDDGSEAGVAWDWVLMDRGIVAMADPMSVVTNLRLLGDAGHVLTAVEAACVLNRIVHALPWQHEVRRLLQCRPQ